MNAESNSGKTAFMLACQRGRKDIVQLLLDHPGKSINFNTWDRLGRNAFKWARIKGHRDIVQLLSEHADVWTLSYF